MKKIIPTAAGIMLILAFSIYPVRLADSFCCFGIVLGGLLGAVLAGRTDNDRLESTRALKIGAGIGVYSAIVVLFLNVLFGATSSDSVVFDPIPGFIYRFFSSMASGIMGIAGDTTPSANLLPDVWWRFIFQLFNNALFGAFGGVIGASLFRQEPPIDEQA